MDELFRALPVLLKELDGNEYIREAIVLAAWRKIAGEPLRDRTIATELDQKRLIVVVENDTWKKHLEALSGQMIFKINSALGQSLVTYIEFRVNELAVRNERRRLGRGWIGPEEMEDLARNQITSKLERESESIADEKLRNLFLRAAGSALAQKERLNRDTTRNE